jgi:hypothetical protein
MGRIIHHRKGTIVDIYQSPIGLLNLNFVKFGSLPYDENGTYPCFLFPSCVGYQSENLT